MSNLAPEQIDATLCVHAQVQPEDMTAIAAAGFRSVVNNRPDLEGGPEQPTSAQLEAAARQAGLEYRYLPVTPMGFTAEQVEGMASAVAELPKPVLAFCRSGRRSAALYLSGKSQA